MRKEIPEQDQVLREPRDPEVWCPGLWSRHLGPAAPRSPTTSVLPTVNRGASLWDQLCSKHVSSLGVTEHLIETLRVLSLFLPDGFLERLSLIRTMTQQLPMLGGPRNPTCSAILFKTRSWAPGSHV